MVLFLAEENLGIFLPNAGGTGQFVENFFDRGGPNEGFVLAPKCECSNASIHLVCRVASITTIDMADSVLKPLEDELVELARNLSRGLNEEDTFLAAKEKVVLEKTRLKQEKQRLQKSHENNWIEPSRKLINTLQTLGKNDV